MIFDEDKLYKVKEIKDNALDDLYQNLLIGILRFEELSEKEYQDFILGYLTYCVNRDNLHPIFFQFKNTSHKDAVAHTSYWEKDKGSIITFDPQFKNLKKPNGYWYLTPILNMLEHECAHNYDYKYFPKTFNPVNNTNGKKEYVYKLLSFKALTKIFEGTEFETFTSRLTYLLNVTSRDEMFAMKRAPQMVQKLINDAQGLSKILNISADLNDMQKVVDLETYGTKELLEIARLLFANKIPTDGKKFSEFKTELNKVYNAIITDNFDGFSEKQKFTILKAKPFLIYLQDIKPFYDQKIIDKLFEKQITSKNVYVADLLLLTNLHYNKNAKKQINQIFEQAQKDNELEFLHTAIKKLQNILPFSRTPFNYYKKLFEEYSNEKTK